MENKRLNRRGASLIEVLAIITLAALVFSVVSNVISSNLRQNALNQERLANSAVANSVANYIKSIPYEQLHDIFYGNPNRERFMLTFDERTCDLLYPPGVMESEREICIKSISPTVNARDYTNDIHIVLLPYDHAPSLFAFAATNPYPVLNDRLDKILAVYDDPLNEDFSPDLIRVFVIVRSRISSSNDLYIEKVTTNEENEILK